jgi:hypothetical protein
MTKTKQSKTIFTWSVSNLERETSDGYVYCAHYTIDATDGVYRVGAYGSIGFERHDDLIPFSDLSESIVIDWVKESLGQEKVTEVEAALDAQLAEQRAPSKASGLPWVKN